MNKTEQNTCWSEDDACLVKLKRRGKNHKDMILPAPSVPGRTGSPMALEYPICYLWISFGHPYKEENEGTETSLTYFARLPVTC